MFRRVTRLGIVIAVIVVLVGVVAAADAVLDLVVEEAIETLGPAITGTSVELEDVDLSIFDGRGSIQGMVIGNPRGFKTRFAFRLREIRVHLVPMSILREKIVIHEIRIDKPDVNFEEKGGTNNLERILGHIKSALGGSGGSETEEDDTKAIWEQLTEQKVQIDHFLMKDAQIHASGGVLEGKRLGMPPLSIELEGLGTGPHGASVAKVSAKVMRAISTRVSLAITERMLTLGLGARGEAAGGEQPSGAESEAEAQGPEAAPGEEAGRRAKRRRR